MLMLLHHMVLQDTMDLARRVGFTQGYSFKYSPRPGTPGADMDNQVPEHIKDEPLQEFQALINKQQLEYNESCVGKVLPILFEKSGKKEGQIVGKSEYMHSVHAVGSDELIGRIIDVKITTAGPNSLGGEII